MAQALVIGIITGSVYGLVALGLVLIYKSSGVFNFAQGEFGTVSAFALYLAHSSGLPYPVAILIGLAAGVLMGLVTEFLVIRPLFEASRVTLLVATAGVALLSIGVVFWLSEARPVRVEPALARVDRVSLFNINISDQRLLILAALVIIGVTLAWFFNRTSLGLAVLAASQEPTATNLMGISVRRISALTWGLAGLLGAVAGVLQAPISTVQAGFLTVGGTGALIPGFTAAVIGGMTSLPGAFAGGIIVGVAAAVSPQIGFLREVPGPSAVATFALLLAVLVIRPQGLFGKVA